MAMKDAKIKYLEHELEEKERVLEQMREVDRTPGPAPVAEDARIGALERRVREARGRGQGPDRGGPGPEGAHAQTGQDGRATRGAVTRPSGAGTDCRAAVLAHGPGPPPERGEACAAAAVSVPAAGSGCEPAPPIPAEEMDLIMQPDGTIKPELRRKNEYIIASNGPQNRRQGSRTAGDRSGRHVDAVIFADEQEPPRPPKKR